MLLNSVQILQTFIANALKRLQKVSKILQIAFKILLNAIKMFYNGNNMLQDVK
jgi:hypothetical protein